ncbi:MAG: hypothetical protein HGA96_10335 [Desulfobulbaceae bacterium]|nr:hypothetical protein [Desulfobulbaceae bacterium]
MGGKSPSSVSLWRLLRLGARLSLLALFLGGCSAPILDLSLRPVTMPPTLGRPVATVLGVDRFVDLRPQTRGDDNQKWLGAVPGVLWLNIASDQPELYSPYSFFNSRPLELSSAEALAFALAEGRVAESVLFLPADPYRPVDYRLEGLLHRTLVRERCYYYGSFMYSWLTRVVGLPYVTYEIEFDLELRLREMQSGRLVWQDRISGHREDKYNNIYRLTQGRDGKHLIAYNFATILAERLPEIESGISRAMQDHR